MLYEKKILYLNLMIGADDFLNEYSLFKSCNKVYGIIGYLDKSYYKDNHNENELIHIQVFCYYLETVKNIDLKKIIIGHEHWTEKEKCHLQIISEKEEQI